MTNSKEFIQSTLKRILEKETQKALEAAKHNTFLKAQEVFAPIIQYGAISSTEFLEICEELNIPTSNSTLAKNISAHNISDHHISHTYTSDDDRDPCSHGSVFGPRSSC